MVKIVAKGRIKEGYKEKYLELAKEMVAGSVAEEGNIFYNLNESLEDPQTVAFIEAWKDQDAIAFHNATDHYTKIGPQLRAMLEAPMEVTKYIEVL